MSKETNDYLRRDSDVPFEIPFPLSENNTRLERLLGKDKRELVEELMWLRESSKDALQKSWNEAENLERLSANHADVINQLNTQLNDVQSKETEWRLRCLAAGKTQSMQSEPTNQTKEISIGHQSCEYLQETKDTSSLENDYDVKQERKNEKLSITFRDKLRSSLSCENLSSSTQFSPTMRFWPSKGLPGKKRIGTKMQSKSDHLMCMSKVYDTSKNSEDFLVETSLHTAGTTCSENEFCINGKVKTKEDISLIISSRDQIISSLEQTLNQQMDSMNNVHAKIQHLMESQRTIEKRLRNSHKEKKNHQTKVIESLRKKLKENGKVVKEKEKSLFEYKVYIHELTDELEKVLKIIKKAEECGFIVDQNLP